MSDGSNTAGNSGKATGRPFTKGDPRINRKGRPKSFDTLRALAQDISHEEATKKDGQPVIINNHKVTVVEAIMRQWATDPKRQELFIAYAFGKVPQPVEVGLEEKLLDLIRSKQMTIEEARQWFPDVTLPVAGIEA